MSHNETRTSKRKPYWLANDKYSRAVPLFTIICFVTVAFNYISENLIHSLGIIAVVGLFYLHQLFRSNLFSRYLTTSDFTYKKPAFLLVSSILFLANWYVANEGADMIHPDTYSSAYIKSLLKSTALFSLSMSIQCLFVKIGIFRPPVIRMGIIGVMQRVFIIARTHKVNMIWINFLTNYSSSKNGKIFCLIKGSMMIYLVYDFHVTIRDFFNNRNKLLVHANEEDAGETCDVCFDEMKEPIILKCEHIFCYNCLIRCAETKAVCPMCREPFTIPTKVEMSNGEIPFMFLMVSI